MKDTKKIKYNLIVGIVGQVVMLILGIVVPKLVLTNYGSEINGLLSSVTNIYAYIALVEAGISAASCQALYKAFADKDRGQINRVLSATNKYYHKTGFIYLALVIAFATLYGVIVKSGIPYHIIFLVVIFNGIGNVINYFFHGKYLILLKADGKNYVRTGVDVFTTSLKQISKIVLISLGYDVVFVQFAAMLVSLAQMIYIVCYINKKYSWIDLKAEPDYKSISQSKNVIVHQINYLVVSNTDTVLLTAFSTLKVVSVYSMYALLFNMVDKVLHVVRDALEFKIANYFHSNKERFLKFFRAYEVYYIAFSFAMYSIVDMFVLPFLSLYTADVTDINYVIAYLPLFFALVKLFNAARYPYDAMVYIAGHFKETQNYAIAESVINIVISLVLVSRFGIAGVLAGTIIASFIHANCLVLYVYKKKIVDSNVLSSYKSLFINFALFVSIDILGGFIKLSPASYFEIVLLCIPYAIVIVLLYLVINSLFEPASFRLVCDTVRSAVKKRMVRGKNEES
ncbi:MAG: sugar isomerase [Ruminococcaceae bacterium]|nr:sugar isomerase [Oscillospiraceae bacterium]